MSESQKPESQKPESQKKEEAPKKPELDIEFENSIDDLDWKEVRKNFFKKHGAGTFNSWIKEISLIDKGEEVHLMCRSAFIADYVIKHFEKDLLAFWKRVNANVKKIKITK